MVFYRLFPANRIYLVISNVSRCNWQSAMNFIKWELRRCIQLLSLFAVAYVCMMMLNVLFSISMGIDLLTKRKMMEIQKRIGIGREALLVEYPCLCILLVLQSLLSSCLIVGAFLVSW